MPDSSVVSREPAPRLCKSAGNGNGGSIETVSLDGGPPSVVLFDPELRSLQPPLLWMRDGRMIFALVDGSGSNGENLWEIMTDPQTGQPSGKPVRITSWGGVEPLIPSVSRGGRRLAVLKSHWRADVYVGELEDAGTRLASPTRLTVSESEDYPSAWMPDSKTILFQSNRTGRNQIFRQTPEQDAAEPVIQG
jgi:eukaryotic-like serine/threonine-protein kinase